ncbi:MAG: hypothetical protein ACR2QW_14745 [bacterium]
MQTAAVATTLWLIWYLARLGNADKRTKAGWLLLALFLSYIAVDDGAMIHERIGTAFKHNNASLTLPSYGWQFIMGPVFAIMGLTMIIFLWKRGSTAIRRDWLVIAFTCMTLAIALDFVEGMENGYQALTNQTGWRVKTITHFSKSLEEFLEMLGMSILLMTFLDHLGYLLERIQVSISGTKVTVTQRKNPE